MLHICCSLLGTISLMKAGKVAQSVVTMPYRVPIILAKLGLNIVVDDGLVHFVTSGSFY